MNTNYVIVAGYGWSGSSAVVDLLREYENILAPDVEFPLIKMPYGIAQLEEVLINNWDPINASVAISDFLWLCQKCYTSMKSSISPVTLNYRKKISSEFMEMTKDYISSISEYNYDLNCFLTSFKQNRIQRLSYLYKCLLYKMGINKKCVPETGKGVYFSAPTETEFIEATRRYIDKLFSGFRTNDECIILDQAISPFNIKPLEYFDHAKMIVVDRNPYDIYVSMVRHKSLLGADLAYKDDIEKYKIWYTKLREKKVNSDNILYIRFEQLVQEYENVKKLIEEFLELDASSHIRKKEFFDPQVSIKKVDVWKQYKEEKKILNCEFGESIL